MDSICTCMRRGMRIASGFRTTLSPAPKGGRGAACGFENGNPSGGGMAVKRKAAIYMGNLMCIFANPESASAERFSREWGKADVRGNQNPTLTPALIRPWTPYPASAKMPAVREKSHCAPMGLSWNAQPVRFHESRLSGE